jgi:formate dehydrogenase subunit gamma
MRSRLAILVLVASLTACALPALAQTDARSPTGSNPVAQSVTEQQILKEMRTVKGRVAIPDPKEAVLEQPQGRQYQAFHERLLPRVGGILILGMLVALMAFYLWRGPIPLDARPTGVKIKRFTVVERLTHWMTAVSFLVLAITGLNYVFGKRLLLPLLGPEAFSVWSEAAKFLHNAFAWPFLLGILIMIVLWVKDNLFDRYDLEWLREFGGFFSHRHPPARRFNAGQKLVFWSVAIGGGILILSGIPLLFPIWSPDIGVLQTAQYVHAILGMIMIAIIIAHIYIGTIGMEGASDAMVSGEVDLAWAKVHHRAWVEEELPRTPDGRQVGGGVPAE